jgi:hypothetical protein
MFAERRSFARETWEKDMTNRGHVSVGVRAIVNENIKRSRLKGILLAAAPVIVLATLQSAPALAQNQNCSVGGLPCVYSVKFVCGVQSPIPNLHLPSEPPVKPGNYATAVNIHNFHQDQKALILKSAVIARPENQPLGQISSVHQVVLGPGQAFEIDCSDIVTLFGTLPVPLPPFIKGFVELRGLPPNPFPTLSVTAVYTAQATAAVGAQTGPVSLEVVPVQPFAGP